MIKVFLVEDEYAIREGIRKAVQWEREGFELVGEAADGEMAFPKIIKSEPDILITDIRMPFMDGLELAKLVKKELPKVKIIILSGYGDFAYAKEAISIGVEEYLLKPLSGEALINELKKVAEVIRNEKQEEESRSKYLEEREEIRILEQQKFLHDMIDGRLSVQDSLEHGRKLGIDITAAWYSIVLIQIFPKALEEQGINTYCDRKEELYGKLRAIYEGEKHVYLYDQVGDILCFLEMSDSREVLDDNIREGLDRIEELLQNETEVLYFVSVGKPVERIRDVNQSYSDASRRFSERYIYEKSHIFRYSDPDMGAERQSSTGRNIDIQNIDISKISSRSVQNFFRNGSLGETEAFVADYFDSIGSEAATSLMLRQFILLGSLLTSVSFLESLGISKDNITEALGELNDSVKYADTMEASVRYLRELLTLTIEWRNQLSDKKYTEIIDKAREYIRENYQNEDMSLQSAASSVNVSSNHFSAIFRKETGETFIEYLTAIRMEKAKELLTCTSMKTSEVGFEVGYRDPHYFSYIFKKLQGMSPKEYRKQRKES